LAPRRGQLLPATIAALQVPGADGTKVDVFKSSVAVAREVGDFLARRR
jgi:hypothetical protein